MRAPATAAVYSRSVGRLLGIFDFESGQSVTDAVVTDLATGARVVSSETGALWLGFVEGPRAVLSIQKPPDSSQTLFASISAWPTRFR